MIVKTEQYRSCELRVVSHAQSFQVDVVDPNHIFIGSSHRHADPRGAMVEAMTLIDQRLDRIRTKRHLEMLQIAPATI
jgi:hypothetical protein